MPEIKANNSDCLADFFASTISDCGHNYAPVYRKAVDSLFNFLERSDISFGDNPAAAVGDWLISLKISGMTYKSAVSYFDAISGLYSKAAKCSIVDDVYALKTVKERLKENDGALWHNGLTDADVQRLKSLTKSVDAGENQTVDLIKLSLLNRCIPIQSVAMLKRDSNLGSIDPEARAIVERNQSSTRKYIFDLKQSRCTLRQLSLELQRMISGLFFSRNIPFFDQVDSTLRSYWAYVALNSGIPSRYVRSAVGIVPPGLEIMQLSAAEDIPGDVYEEAFASVARAFVDNPRRWYVMRLRPRIKYADLTRRLDTLGSHTDAPELFYPCDEIMRRVGRRRIVESRPVIPDIVFFRSRSTAISRLFADIGDLAWCYTVSGRTGDSYAAISDSAFRLFQQTIGQFTPDYEVAPIGTIPLRENDRVVIVGGPYQGREGRLLNPGHPSDDGITVYRLQLYNDLGIEWTVCADSRQLRKAEAKSGS